MDKKFSIIDRAPTMLVMTSLTNRDQLWLVHIYFFIKM